MTCELASVIHSQEHMSMTCRLNFLRIEYKVRRPIRTRTKVEHITMGWGVYFGYCAGSERGLGSGLDQFQSWVEVVNLTDKI